MDAAMILAGAGPGVARLAEVGASLAVTAERVAFVEEKLLQFPQVDCPLRHIFAEGVCIREVEMPAGAIVIGHAHRFADMNIVLKGRLTLLLADGSPHEVCAPQTFLGTPGRKIAYIQEDTVWQNVWPTRLSDGRDLYADIEAIEAHYLDKSPGWQADQAQRMAIAKLAREGDRKDFACFMQVWGFDAAEVRRISEDLSDQCEFPADAMVIMVQVRDSAIEGKGLFATSNFAAGEIIAPARIQGKRTPAGRFTNHAKTPNAEMRARPSGDMDLVALAAISGCKGGQPGEEITVDYRQALLENCKIKQKGF